jgi:hypothetical protein
VVPGSLTGSVTSTGITINWTTDEPTSTQLVYGLTIETNQTTGQLDISPRVTSHSMILTDLLACTTYFYQTVSEDAAGNETVDGIHEITTSGCP